MSNQFAKIDSITYQGAICEMWGIESQLMLSVGSFQSPCADPTGGALEKVMLDTTFNLTSCFTFNNLGSITISAVTQFITIRQNHTALKPISKNKTVAIGPMSIFSLLNSNPHFCIVNSIIDNNNVVVNKTVTCNSLTNTSYADGSNILAVELNEILTVGYVGFDSQAFNMNQTQNNKIFVNKFDTLGNLIWQRQHGGDFFYNPTGIVFTTDGGSLISGWRYSTPPDPNKITPIESFLLKLDVNGEYQYVGIAENSINSQTEIKCFPNPANDKLFFDIPFQDKIEISIYSTIGEEVLDIKNYQNLTSVKIDNLINGVYFYKIKTKAKNYSGKFVKE